MQEEQAVKRAREDQEEGKSPSTQAGEFVREVIHHVREGKHGARSPQQVIAIGLSKARRAGVKLPSPRKGSVSSKTRARAARESRRAKSSSMRKPSRARSRSTTRALKREGHSAVSRASLSKRARTASRNRSAQSRRLGARKAARTRSARRKSRR